MIHAKVQGKLDEHLDLIKMLTNKTTKNGCLYYAFNQNQEDPADFFIRAMVKSG